MNVLHIYLHVYFHFSSWIILKIEFVTYICKEIILFLYLCLYDIYEPSSFSYFFFLCRSYRLAAYRSRRKFKTERRPFHYVPKGRPVLPPDGKYTTEPLTYIRSGGRDLNGNTCTGKWFSTTPTNPKL